MVLLTDMMQSMLQLSSHSTVSTWSLHRLGAAHPGARSTARCCQRCNLQAPIHPLPIGTSQRSTPLQARRKQQPGPACNPFSTTPLDQSPPPGPVAHRAQLKHADTTCDAVDGSTSLGNFLGPRPVAVPGLAVSCAGARPSWSQPASINVFYLASGSMA